MSHAPCNGWSIYALAKSGESDYRYVGLTRQPLTLRLHQHLSLAKSEGKQRHVTYWIRSVGFDVSIHELESIPSGELELLYQREIYWISRLRCEGHHLTNISEGGVSGSVGARWKLEEDQIRRGENHPFFGKNHTEEAKSTISKKKLGVPRTEESRRKQGASISGENHWAYGGGKFSDEHRRKLSEAGMGKKMSDEARRRLSEAKKGIKLSEEARKSRKALAPRGVNHHAYGKPAHNKGKPNPSAHIRWHVNKNVSKPETCKFCVEKDINDQ